MPYQTGKRYSSVALLFCPSHEERFDLFYCIDVYWLKGFVLIKKEINLGSLENSSSKRHNLDYMTSSANMDYDITLQCYVALVPKILLLYYIKLALSWLPTGWRHVGRTRTTWCRMAEKERSEKKERSEELRWKSWERFARWPSTGMSDKESWKSYVPHCT